MDLQIAIDRRCCSSLGQITICDLQFTNCQFAIDAIRLFSSWRCMQAQSRILATTFVFVQDKTNLLTREADDRSQWKEFAKSRQIKRQIKISALVKGPSKRIAISRLQFARARSLVHFSMGQPKSH